MNNLLNYSVFTKYTDLFLKKNVKMYVFLK